MKLIKVFSSFSTSQNCMDVYMRLYDLCNNPRYNVDFKFTNDNDYTHVIILNTAMPILTIPKENVIGLAIEPVEFLGLIQQFVDYSRAHIGKYLIGSHAEQLGLPFVNHYSYMWHTPPLKQTPTKTKLISLMVSEKTFAPGHKYRHEMVRAILQSSLKIDIYGRGCRYYDAMDPRICGEFTSKQPYENYQFHICIENYQKPHYFSEKISDALLCSTSPIYLGCHNIDTYFPGNVICLTGSIEKDMQLLHNIVNDPIKYRTLIDPAEIIETLSIVNVVNMF
jgi:hypothetical protein